MHTSLESGTIHHLPWLSVDAPGLCLRFRPTQGADLDEEIFRRLERHARLRLPLPHLHQATLHTPQRLLRLLCLLRHVVPGPGGVEAARAVE